VKAWYCPSFNGDLRLEPDPKNDKKTLLHIVRPTIDERRILTAIAVAFESRKWIDKDTKLDQLSKLFKSKKVAVDAPIEDVGPVVVAIMKPGAAVLTAVRFKDGHVETCEKHVEGVLPGKTPPYRDQIPTLPEAPSKELTALAKKPDAKAAATVSRPTPSCPNCYSDAIAPATEVLLSFLDEEQHASWSKHRFIVVQGGLTGHRYMLAHRHSARAIRNTRICRDLDDNGVVHFHDTNVPPEEEVLAAKLILEHREPWLRNEATCLGGYFNYKFKNPFGDSSDGIVDADFTFRFGIIAQALQ
jgi:hypothetical protein